MKPLIILLILLLFCSFQQDEKLSPEEVAQIKAAVLKRNESHRQDLMNLNYEKMMTFYANVDDFVIFGDGYYWGGYQTIAQIWKDFTGGVKKMLKWDVKNQKVYVFSREAANILMEYDQIRINGDGDTTKGTGYLVYGMQKIDGDWKAVTMSITHDYKVGYGAGGDKFWWKRYTPEALKKRDK